MFDTAAEMHYPRPSFIVESKFDFVACCLSHHMNISNFVIPPSG
jgi:hypothetical protein